MSISIKDIDTVIRNLEYEGHCAEELESLLIHSDDLFRLLQSIDKNKSEMTVEWNGIDRSPNGVRICGVKIIESQHVELGSIHKIFKNYEKQTIYPDSIIPISGVLYPSSWQSPSLRTVLDEKPKKKQKERKRTRRVQLG